MSDKKTRIEYVYDIFTQQYERSFKKDKLITPEQTDKINKFVLNFEDRLEIIKPLLTIHNNVMDMSFVNFYIHSFSVDELVKNTYKNTGLVKDAIFQYFLDHDPSHNKEYVSWFINLYAELCKDRPQITQFNKTGVNFTNSTVNAEKLFFEDFGKIADAIETFNLIKKTKILKTEQKDINSYKSYHDFINTIKPYTSSEDDDSNSVHTLSLSEIKCIQNMVNDESEPPIAELVFESEKWVIVITHDKESNYIFGKNTTWCTAGTRHNTMFDNYNKQGPLFVLIKKGFGSRKAIQTDASVRIQFHFETNQFMDAQDKPIKISEFLINNKEIKEFFRSYVVKTVKKKSLSNNKTSTESIIDFLTKLGYIDELIPILRDAKAEVLNLRETAIEKDVLTKIGEIKTLKTLIMSDCGLTELPDGLRQLTHLVNLDISKNKKITSVPSFLNELVNLESLDMSWCNIDKEFDISDLTKLKLLVLDSNPNLNSLPKGFHNCKNLKRISASCCNLSEIPNIILTLPELYMLDFHKNENLSEVPETLTAMEKVIAVNLDKCNYSNNLHEILTKNAKAKAKKCSYVHYIEN